MFQVIQCEGHLSVESYPVNSSTAKLLLVFFSMRRLNRRKCVSSPATSFTNQQRIYNQQSALIFELPVRLEIGKGWGKCEWIFPKLVDESIVGKGLINS